ncbi:PLP-dependent aminotransferase family protein [Psychromonas antarctica]|uniref:aminotransferase-like domain-containing protein n=1 Tax=Psychromonas antarctica TaxID=67573 RepID=UPI001EE8EF33|nr:PLP-dependent aminotransferase family protein [Psychromonas antarctica]MCG6200450.1 PLP-dependent aminotransferase family protein [Psychromonas antarctica]
MNELFSNRISGVAPSFIREILKVAVDPAIISFAGGLPNRDLFPVEALQQATNDLFNEDGKDILQYSSTEGYLPLREMIACDYRRKGLEISVDEILITNGSQQGLDLLGKVLINEGDEVLIEEPGYLGAIQAFEVYSAKFKPVPVGQDGMDIDALQDTLKTTQAKLIYTVPNFQNPSGISYTNENRQAVADCLSKTKTLLIEDNPYGELRFSGEEKRSFKAFLPEQTILLGSFSKTVVPSFRLGWIAAPKALMEKLVIAKQAGDLHTNYFCQRVLHRFLKDNDLDAHIKKIIGVYGKQKQVMENAIKRCFPKQVTYLNPEGGMFLWVTLPEGMSAMTLFEKAIKDKVAFVPGDPFYVTKRDLNTLRLNFSSVDPDVIEEGIKRLGKVLHELLDN